MTGTEVVKAKAELRRRVLNELRKRDPVEHKKAIRDDVLKSLTAKQRMVVEALDNGTRYIALCCSRRAGKTKLMAKLYLLCLLKCGFEEGLFYVAPTLQQGKRLIWKDLERTIRHYGLDRASGGGWKLNEQVGEISTPEGGGFFIMGLNKQKQASLGTRGFKARLVGIDECQDLDHLLKPLLTSVSPSLSDVRGSFIAAGTPGDSEEGTWYDVAHGKTSGFVPFHWTIRDNEKFPRPVEETLREERELNGWDEDHPDYQREWLGIWAPNPENKVCDFLNERNIVTELPSGYSLSWRHVIGMDYGWDDSITWVVVAANPFGPERVVVHAETHSRMDNDDASTVTSGLVERFQTSYVVCDPAGGGKGFFSTFNMRYGSDLGCLIQPANKLGKYESTKTINTELRRLLPGQSIGRLTVLSPDADCLAKELRVLRWKDKAKGEILTSKTLRDDVFDGFRYAMVEIAPWQPKTAPEDTPEKQAERTYQEKLKRDENARRREKANRAARSRLGDWSSGR